MDIEHVRSRFIKHFDGKTGNIYASPGRINLIGEHTDYNGGMNQQKNTRGPYK